MNHKEDPQMGPWMNAPGTNDPWYAAPGSEKSAYYKSGVDPMMSGADAYPFVYPDIYYILQPHILMVCDRMEMYGDKMPTADMVEQMSDEIVEKVGRMYPELKDYASIYEAKSHTTSASNDPAAVEAQFIVPMGIGRPFGFRRRGLFPNLVDILLWNELFRRRRRRWDWDY